MEVRDSATTIFFNFNVFRLDCGKVDRISSQDKKTMREGRKNLDGRAQERREKKTLPACALPNRERTTRFDYCEKID